LRWRSSPGCSGLGGSRNFGIVFVWIVWWALLIVVLIPFAGRLWCAICPVPAPGEWLQRRGIVRRTPGRLRTLRRRWPRRLKNMWLQNAGFLLVALFSAIILTRPAVSAWLLLGFTVVAVGLSVIYDNRVFCRYVCPVGGFIGLYAMMSPLELRVRDCQTCKEHTSKDCVTGNAQGYGCPWMVYPGAGATPTGAVHGVSEDLPEGQHHA
jgi:polyferredoxin